MKRKLIPLLAVAIALLMPGTVSAIEQPQYNDIDYLLKASVIDQQSQIPFAISVIETRTVEVKTPEPSIYIVVSGDNLTKIGTANNVEWQRLWAKNTHLIHPDLLYIGDKITIPEPSEQLERALPAVVALPAKTPGVAPLRSYDGTNTYDYGYCTWYVKNRRGLSLPNNLGNANTWYSRASAAGMAVGNVPRAGAVGATTRGSFGHVVYVESVNGDGTINISEMNYKSWGVQSSRTTSPSEFVYIY